VRRAGDGDFILGARRVIEACAAVDCTDLWTSLASYQDSAWGVHAIDRFRTDVSWPDQLEYSARVLVRIADVLRATGSTVSVETHEEITSTEVAWLADRVGRDVVSATLDPANSVVRGELPNSAAHRLAGMVRRTHFRDVILRRRGPDLVRSLAACGDGRIDWQDILHAIVIPDAQLHLTIENPTDTSVETIPICDPLWRHSCDVEPSEVEELGQWADAAAQDEARRPLSREEQFAFIQRSAAFLRTAWINLQSGN
jgi:sugar phosphate isomerase/epimerase